MFWYICPSNDTNDNILSEARLFTFLSAGISHQRDVTGGSTMLDTVMHSEYRQTESPKNPPRKLYILEKGDGFYQDADVVRLTLTNTAENFTNNVP